ncbi:MAG: hypothetical protein JNL58_16255 [Planctomyces sp.]|nr:hypothetical protein [Planctomyces sp.]
MSGDERSLSIVIAGSLRLHGGNRMLVVYAEVVYVVLSIMILSAQSILLSAHIPADGLPDDFSEERVQWQLRDVWRLEFTGNTTFTDKNLKSSLALDGTTQGTVDVTRPLGDFCQIVTERLTAGYRQSGFYEVNCETLFDQDRNCVRVTLVEGARYKRGPIVISKCDDPALAEMIEQLLLFNRPVRLGAEPQYASAPGSVPQHNFAAGPPVVSSESPSQKSGPMWKPDGFASFSKQSETAVADQIETLLKEHGYGFAEVSVEIKPDPETRTARLIVDLSRIGSPQPVREIQFQGLTRHTPEQLLDFLNLSHSQLYDTHQLRQHITQSLLRTGRFIHVATTSETPFDASQPVALFVRVREFERVPPLSESISPELEVGLKLAQWLNNWQESGSDLHFVLRFSSLETPIDLSTIGQAVGGSVGETVARNTSSFGLRDMNLEFITAPGEGGLLRIQAGTSKGKVLVDYSVLLTRQQVGIIAWPTQRKWLISDPTAGVTQTLQLSGLPEADEGRNFKLLGGFGFKSDSANAVAPVSAQIHVDAAGILDLMVRPDSGTVTLMEDGVCTCTGNGWSLKVDAESGALIQMTSESVGPEGSGMKSITAEPGLLARRLAEVSEKSSTMANSAKSAEGWKSLLTFSAQEVVAFCEQSGDRASPVLMAVLKNQSAISQVADQLEDLTHREHFQIPADTKQQTGSSDSTTWMLNIARSLLPAGTMPHRLSNALMLANTQQEVRPLLRLVNEVERDPVHGPLTCLLTATLIQTERARLARAGLARLDSASADAELRLLLKDPGVIREFLFGGIQFLRKVPDDQMQLLLLSADEMMKTPATDDQPSQPGVDIKPLLMLVRNHPSEDPMEVVASLYGMAWTIGGKSFVESVLESYVAPTQTIRVLQLPETPTTPLR